VRGLIAEAEGRPAHSADGSCVAEIRLQPGAAYLHPVARALSGI